jgi:ribonuclease D
LKNDVVETSKKVTKKVAHEHARIPFGQDGFQISSAAKPSTISSGTATNVAEAATYYSHELYRGPKGEQVTVKYCTTTEDCERTAKLFLNERVVGFDMEWSMYLKASDPITNFVSCIQVASESQIAIFHLSLCSSNKGNTEVVGDIMAPSLVQLIQSPDILKTGVNIAGDGRRLSQHLHLKPRALFELSHYHNILADRRTATGAITKALYSLDKMTQDYLGYKMDKGMVRTAGWTNQLNQTQKSYAATDAYASLHLFFELERRCRKHVEPTPTRSGGIVGEERFNHADPSSLPEKERSTTEQIDDSDPCSHSEIPSPLLGIFAATVQAQFVSLKGSINEKDSLLGSQFEGRENLRQKATLANGNRRSRRKRPIEAALRKADADKMLAGAGAGANPSSAGTWAEAEEKRKRVQKARNSKAEGTAARLMARSLTSQPLNNKTLTSRWICRIARKPKLKLVLKISTPIVRGRKIHMLPKRTSEGFAESSPQSSVAGSEVDWESDSESDSKLDTLQSENQLALLIRMVMVITSSFSLSPTELLRQNRKKALTELEKEESDWDEVEDETEETEDDDEISGSES